MLEQIKLALRITTDAFDEEIQMLIDAAIAEMQGLGVTASVEGSEDPQIVTAVVAYCKWQFGANEDADRWRDIYHTKLAQLKTMTGYTDWGN